MPRSIVILGVFMADTSYRAARQPRMGETLKGLEFRLGPGGKGSNQAVAAARAGGAGAQVHFISRLGRDAFAEMALGIWREAGVTPAITQHAEHATGAADIFIDAATGDNAIIICPGVAEHISPADIDRNAGLLDGAGIFMTQLEQPIEAALAGLRAARARGVTTILNPAPATDLPDGVLALCDYVTPNETEAEGLTGIRVENLDDAEQAARALVRAGAGAAIVTLGNAGSLFFDGRAAHHIAPVDAGPVVETTGAGDCFNGAFAAALARDTPPLDSAHFASAAAAISVTRPGTAGAMPAFEEIRALIGA